MISRKSAKATADAYVEWFSFSHFTGRNYQELVRGERLDDFLFENNFPAWLLNAFKKLDRYPTRPLQEFVMRLHTGESVVSVTTNWDWQQREKLGQQLLRELAQTIIQARLSSQSLGTNQKLTVDTMRKLLELDGYIFQDGVLLVPEESVVDEEEQQGLLERMFQELALKDLATFRHHLALSASHYHDGRWDDSIANSRKVFELVLREVAQRHAARAAAPLGDDEANKPVRVREYLRRQGLLEQKEIEAVEKIYGLLSETGAHPYTARRDQARLLRHYALTTCQFVMLRLKGAFEPS
jgi:hypothetical protein